MVFNATFDNISVQLYHGGRLKTGIVQTKHLTQKKKDLY